MPKNKKLKIAVVFGGRSGEHEVSLISARSVMQTLNPQKYQIIPVLIDKKGRGFEKIVAQRKKIDAVFPLIHGTFGEDGTLQGFLEICGLPYVGAGVTGSAVGMDKILQKQILERTGLPITPYFWFRKEDWQKNPSVILRHIKNKQDLSGDKFVKPANSGSSVGINLKVPAKLPERIHRCIREMTKKAFIALDCAGMARAEPFRVLPPLACIPSCGKGAV